MTFGYYDKTKYTGNMHWSPVLFKYMFAVQLDDIIVNGESLGLCGPKGINTTNCIITVDSGTSYMSMPTWALDEIKDTIPTVDKGIECESPEDFGELTFVINGKNFTFSADEYIYPPGGDTYLPPDHRDSKDLPQITQEDKDKNMILLGQGDTGMLASVKSRVKHSLTQVKSFIEKKFEDEKSEKKKCKGTFMAMDLDRDMFLVGDMFMRKYYSVFDRDNNRVGLAEAVVLE